MPPGGNPPPLISLSAARAASWNNFLSHNIGGNWEGGCAPATLFLIPVLNPVRVQTGASLIQIRIGGIVAPPPYFL